MRVAVVSDVHGNRTALEAVIADLAETAPDLVVHGGDLADTGSSPVHVVDRIRELGWSGVFGNTDELLFRPASLREFAREFPESQGIFRRVEETAAASRARLGPERLSWLQGLPGTYVGDGWALVHASPDDAWRAPSATAEDRRFEQAYGPLGRRIVVYGHLHTPFVRTLAGMTVVNSGSVGMPYDGDQRASYALLDVDAGRATIRRVEYDLESELRALARSGLPHADWTAEVMRGASFVTPRAED